MAQMQAKTKLQVAIIPHSLRLVSYWLLAGLCLNREICTGATIYVFMRIMLFRIALLACVPWMLYAQTENKKSAAPAPSIPDNKGSIVGGNTYKNPALDMTIALTGEWEFLDQETTRQAEGIEDSETTPRSGCQGPLCGTPEINIALKTKPEAASTVPAVSTIFLAGFKLAPQYLNREQYPLKNFAEIMLNGSTGSAGMVPADSLTSVQLGGRPAYRLLVRDPEAEASHEAGYVVESNGYILLLVGATSTPADLPKLQSAIEGLKFTPPAKPLP